MNAGWLLHRAHEKSHERWSLVVVAPAAGYLRVVHVLVGLDCEHGAVRVCVRGRWL
jgi:hypothetical protein